MLFLVLFSCLMFLPFCFYVGIVFGMFVFCFCFVSCFAFRLCKKHCFPCKFWRFLSYVGYKVVYFVCFMIWFVHFCVVCLQSKQWSCSVLCLCCLFFVTRLSGFLVCILWVRFPFLVFQSSQKTDTAKTKKMQKKRTFVSVSRVVCSQIVFLVVSE